MITSRQLQIIHFMMERKKAVTSNVIAQKLGVSPRTIKNELQLMKKELQVHGCTLSAKKGIGYVLDITNQTAFESFLSANQANQHMTTTEERNSTLLCILLTSPTLLHLQDLEDMMFCNRNTILHCIKNISGILIDYDLKLQSSNKGYLIVGKEYHKRVCIHNLLKRKYAFIQDEFSKYLCNMEDKKNITKVVITCLHEEDEKAISKVSIDEIVDYLYLFHKRNLEQQKVQFTKKDQLLIEEFPITYRTSKKIIGKLAIDHQFQYEDEDIIMLLILLMSYRISNISFAKDSLRKELQEIAEQCLVYVHQKMGIAMNQENDDLCMNIVRYLRSFQIRNKYKIIIRIDYISYVKMRRSFMPALDMSYYCLEYLYNKYGYMLNEDEILYLTPSFVKYQNAMGKNKQYHVLVISSSGMMFGNLIVERLKKDFNDSIHKIEVKEYYLINEKDLEEVDVIISDLSKQELNISDIPVCQINGILDNPQERMDVLHFLTGLNQLKINNVFCEKQFLTQWYANNKNEVFFQLINLLSEYHPEIDKTMFLRELVKRETIFSFECGNNAAVCFLYDDRYLEERLFVIVLKRPIVWNKEIVQVLFVFCFNRKQYENYLFIVAQTSKLLQDYEMISLLINHQDYQMITKLV